MIPAGPPDLRTSEMIPNAHYHDLTVVSTK
jgi:hypothetical protein